MTEKQTHCPGTQPKHCPQEHQEEMPDEIFQVPFVKNSATDRVQYLLDKFDRFFVQTAVLNAFVKVFGAQC